MKRILFFTVLIFSVMHIYAQQGKDTLYLTPEELVGTWQQGDSIVGAGFAQNFIFSKDSNFVVNFTNDVDAQDILQLKGKYRLVKDSLYFLVISRKVIIGNIVMGAIGSDFSLFYINRYGKIEEVPEDNPQELEPCYITVFDKKHIKINNEEYYKISEQELKDE